MPACGRALRAMRMFHNLGDNIARTLVFESIGEPEAGVGYLRFRQVSRRRKV